MCANAQDHNAYIRATRAGDEKSAAAIAAGEMTAAQYDEKVKAETKEAAPEDAKSEESATAEPAVA